MNRFVIAAYVENKYGVLTRVASLFMRKGFNIDSLSVGETESHEYSRITLTASGDNATRDQMVNQMQKLHNVKRVMVLDENSSLERELMFVKVKNTPRQDRGLQPGDALRGAHGQSGQDQCLCDPHEAAWHRGALPHRRRRAGAQPLDYRLIKFSKIEGVKPA